MLPSQIAALLLAGAIIGSAATLHRQQITAAVRRLVQAVRDLLNQAVAHVPVLRVVCAPHPGHHTGQWFDTHPRSGAAAKGGA